MARHHHGRSGNRPQRVSLDAGSDATSGVGGLDPGSDTHDPERLALFTDFHTAVGRLPDDLRQVVDLHWYQDFTHQEVGSLLGIAEATSRKYWEAARLCLTDALGTNPFDATGA